MKRAFSFEHGSVALLVAGTSLVAATYGLVRLAYGLFLPDVQAELALTDAAAGLVSSGASAVYVLGAVTAFLAAGHHPRRLVVVAALTAGGGAASMAAAPSVAVFAVAAILSSAGAGLASPALVTLVRRNVPPRADARAQLIVNAGTGPGLVAAGGLALLLLPDWRTAWFLVAATTAVIAALVLLLDRPRGTTLAAPQTSLPPTSLPPTSLPSAAWFRAHRLVIAVAVLLGAGSATTWTYGRSLLVAGGASETESVGAWVALGLGGTAVIVTARGLGRLRPSTAWSVTVSTLAVASAVLGAAPHVTTLALAACVALGWGYTAGSGVLIAWTTELDPRRAASGTSMLFVVLILGQACGAAAAGVLAERASLAVAFLVAAVVVAVAAAVPALVPAGGAPDVRVVGATTPPYRERGPAPAQTRGGPTRRQEVRDGPGPGADPRRTG